MSIKDSADAGVLNDEGRTGIERYFPLSDRLPASAFAHAVVSHRTGAASTAVQN